MIQSCIVLALGVFLGPERWLTSLEMPTTVAAFAIAAGANYYVASGRCEHHAHRVVTALGWRGALLQQRLTQVFLVLGFFVVAMGFFIGAVVAMQLF